MPKGTSLERAVGRLEAVTESLVLSVPKLDEAIKNLPCTSNIARIGDLEKWKDTCNGEKQEEKQLEDAVVLEKVKGTISLKNALILAIVSAAVSGFIGAASVMAANTMLIHVP